MVHSSSMGIEGIDGINIKKMNCCGVNSSYNAKCTSFYTSVLFSLVILAFAIIKLFTIDPLAGKSVYIGLITSIVGIYVPNPRLLRVYANTSVKSPIVVTT